MIRQWATHCSWLCFYALLPVCAFATDRPNILLLVAEDLSPRIGAFGDAVAHTPNLDRLAVRGTRYTRVFTTAGVCAPSRAALVTGQHQISFGGQHMRASTGPLGAYYAQPPAGLRAFPELLRQDGYYTFTDTKLDYQFSGIRAGSGPFSIWDAEAAADTAWRDRTAGQPFFGLINFIETHESGVMRQTGEPHSNVHKATQTWRAGITKQVVEHVRAQDIVVPPYYPDTFVTRADMARHYNNIALMDARVGKILAALEADGLAASTIVIWTTDHGDGLPRAKRELLDTGLHVPMIVVDPRHQQPSVDGRMVSFVDLAPTILQLAGTPVPSYLQGRNFIRGAARRYIFAARDRIDEIPDRQRAIRDHRYKLIKSWQPHIPGGHALAYRDNLDMVRAWRAAFTEGSLKPVQARWFEPVGPLRLFDLHQDPMELRNLAQDPTYKPILVRLTTALANFQQRVGDTSEIPEKKLRQSYLTDGEVPTTPPPRIRRHGSQIVLESAVEASIGYRRGGETTWRLYVQPLELAGEETLEAKAVRYGWHESKIVTASP